MNAPSVRDVLSVIRAWAAVNYPGCPLEHVAIHLRYLSCPVTLADSPTIPSADVGAVLDERGARGLSPCVLDILKVLREVRRPLSRTRLLEEMARRGMDWSERTVARYVADLMADGTIVNPEGEHPRGYRMASPEDEPS
jgi:hypothetical protein